MQSAKPASRKVLYAAAIVASLMMGAAVAAATGAPAKPTITVYKSATCGCCGKWIDHLARNGLPSTTVLENDLAGFQRRLALPVRLQSCHVALAGRYLVVGHVPAEDIKRLLAEKPEGRGIAVGGMPMGSPGMEQGGKTQPFETLLFQADGSTSVFARHP